MRAEPDAETAQRQPIKADLRAYLTGIWGADGFVFCVKGWSWHAVDNPCSIGEHLAPTPADAEQRPSE